MRPDNRNVESTRLDIQPGAEGTSHVMARQLVAVQPLVDRSTMERKERIMLLDSDIREAMALAARRLNAEAMKYRVAGFDWDLEDIVYDHGGSRIITATLRISREPK